VGTESGLTLSY